MIVGTKKWVVVLEGDVPVGAPDDAWRSLLAQISVPLVVMQGMAGSRILIGTPEQLAGDGGGLVQP